MYKIEITRFQPHGTKQRLAVADAAQAAAVIANLDDGAAVIFVADIRDHIDHGNFYVWWSAGQAYVRLDEHREHYARYRDTATIRQGEAMFLDEDGASFSVLPADIVSVSSAKEALVHWLLTGRATDALIWS